VRRLSRPDYVCIHGHFYQPARDDPFTQEVRSEPSAAPFANWNERVTAECYAPNLSAPVLAADGEPRRRINNFEWISFDLGPTILEWLKHNRNNVYRGIIDADRASTARFGGHGSAMAQSYNHTILPLSNSLDRKTQIRWGVRDFEHRFGRAPEGMWLPETAVDAETLRLLGEEGILFTVLAPHQAEAVTGADGEWRDAADGGVDTRIPYRVSIGDGKEIAVFFYNGPLSQKIAFDGLLDDGHRLANALIEGLGAERDGPRLTHAATDGESYGHHHRFGEMALAVAIEEVEKRSDARMTNYAEFLALHPPDREARVVEDSSWSCAHGVERWRSDCGCSTGAEPGWTQKWRTPLRDGLDWLRDRLGAAFESLRGTTLIDPWEARDDYISVLTGTPRDEFLRRHAAPGLGAAKREEALAYLEMQQRLMFMYTSCGWFFGDVAGLETLIVLRQAARAIDLSRQVGGPDVEEGFLNRLSRAASNIDGRTAAEIYVAEVSSGPAEANNGE